MYLRHVDPELQEDRDWMLDLVKATRCWWLPHFAENKKLAKDEAFMAECKAAASCGLVFTYYQDFNCFKLMRKMFPTAGASVPGGQACFGDGGKGGLLLEQACDHFFGVGLFQAGCSRLLLWTRFFFHVGQLSSFLHFGGHASGLH